MLRANNLCVWCENVVVVFVKGTTPGALYVFRSGSVSRKERLSFFVAVGSLFTIFGLLTSRSTSVCPRDVFLFLGFGFYLSIVALGLRSPFENQSAALNYFVYLIHSSVDDEWLKKEPAQENICSSVPTLSYN